LAADLGNAGFQRHLSVSNDKLGDLAVAVGDAGTAERSASETVGGRMYVPSMRLEQVVPEELAEMSPGPGLAAALDTLEHRRVPNDEIVEVLEAQSRQLAHEQARMFAVMNEVLHRLPAGGPGAVRRGSGPAPYAADEVRAALVWSRRSADRETDLAFALVVGLPAVQEALSEGRIDRGKAVVFADHLADLTPEQAASICGRVLPVAGGLTPWQIADRIKKLILELDPEYYERRYAKAIRDRKVIAYLDADGAAVITGIGLPAEDAAAAVERIDRLARAVRRAGHPSTLDQLRADVFLGLLDGSLHGLSRDGIIEALLARIRGGSGEGVPGAAVVGHGDPRGGSDPSESGSGRPATAAPSAAGSDPADGEPACAGPSRDGAAGGDPVGDDPTQDRPACADPADGGPAGGDPVGRSSPDSVDLTGADPIAPDLAGTGVEVRVALSTLLGHDRRPGELPGWGPIPATTARTIVARQTRAEWRWVVLDRDGRWMSDGITRRRPDGARRDGTRAGVVELRIPESLLVDLVADPAAAGPWVRPIADIAAQHRDRDQRVRDLDAHPDDRYPRADLRRHIQIRDRYCVFRGCRTPARRADQDHSIDHARGGPTAAADLGPACRHDHMLKTEGGWELHQPESGVFVWTSPLGRRYPVRPEPIQPPPVDPVVRDPDPGHDEPADPTERPLDLQPGRRAPPQPRTPPVRRRIILNWDGDPAGEPDDPPPF
jgi:hypothetical protein